MKNIVKTKFELKSRICFLQKEILFCHPPRSPPPSSDLKSDALTTRP